MSSGGPPPVQERRGLVVWDFDWSLINENSDTYVVKKLGDYEDFRRKRHEPEFAVFTDLMHEAMRCIHAAGHRRAAIEECLANIPVFPEHIEAIKMISERGHEQIIVSDANSVFIEIIIEAIGLSDIFPPERIFTNPARWDDNEQLHVTWAHPKRSPPHECLFCTRNICKGIILRKWLTSYDEASAPRPAKIAYVGDGGGDLCPCLSLGENDVILARRDYTLHKRLTSEQFASDVRGTVHAWTDGGDVQRVFRDVLPDAKSNL